MSMHAFESLSDDDRDELTRRGQVHGLRADEMYAADAAGMQPHQYAAFKSMSSVTDYAQYQKEEAARQEAERELAVAAAKARILKGR